MYPLLSGNVYCSATRKHDTFDRNIVVPNGDVYLCCMDYALKHYIGNLFETDFYNLDRSKLIELANIKDDTELICRKCIMGKNK